VVEGTGGARKVRFSGKGKGKSGGYRVITSFAGTDLRTVLADIAMTYKPGRESR